MFGWRDLFYLLGWCNSMQDNRVVFLESPESKLGMALKTPLPLFSLASSQCSQSCIYMPQICTPVHKTKVIGFIINTSQIQTYNNIQ